MCEVEISRGATRVNGRRGIECAKVGLVGVWATLPFSDKFGVNDSKVEQRIDEDAGSNIHNSHRSRVDRVRPKLDIEGCDVSNIPLRVVPCDRALRRIPTYIWPSTFHAPRSHVNSVTVIATAFLQKDRVACIGVLVPSRGLRGYVS